MRRRIGMLTLIACLSLCLTQSGCVPVYYAYPKVAYVPPLHLEKTPDTIHAFRVDIADDDGCIEFNLGYRERDRDRYVLSTVPLSDSGRLPSQAKISLDWGFIWNCIALIYDGHTVHTVRVRLYRPGWQTVEVKSWEQVDALKWKEAPSLVEQEKAIDDLVSTWETDYLNRFAQSSSSESHPRPPAGVALFRGLAPGSESAKHRQVLLFAAGEYERLAAFTDSSETGKLLHTRLNEKANMLRELAMR